MSLLLAGLLACPVMAAEWTPPAEGSSNPPASEALKNFQHFELKPVIALPPFNEKGTTESAVAHLEANMRERATQRVREWNADASAGGRTLVIEPMIEHIRFVTPARRVFLGVLMGGSHVDMKLRLTDRDTGQVIAEPRFYQHANAGAAGWAFGAVDRALLIRLTNMVDAYLRDNYEQPTASRMDLMPELTPAQEADAVARAQRAGPEPE